MSLRKAFTIAEMIVVLCLLAALATLTLPIMSGTLSVAASATTQSTLREVANATCHYWSDCKTLNLDGIATVADETTRFQMRWLFRNPQNDSSVSSFNLNSAIGWNGPDLMCSTGSPVAFGDVTIIDAWNHAVVMQDVNSAATRRDVRIVSPGPNGVINIPGGVATSALNASDVGDDLYVALLLH